jgi:hypothetical protein
MSSGCYSKDSARFSSRRASAVKGVGAIESTRWRFLAGRSSGLDPLRLLELLRIQSATSLCGLYKYSANSIESARRLRARRGIRVRGDYYN